MEDVDGERVVDPRSEMHKQREPGDREHPQVRDSAPLGRGAEQLDDYLVDPGGRGVVVGVVRVELTSDVAKVDFTP